MSARVCTDECTFSHGCLRRWLSVHATVWSCFPCEYLWGFFPSDCVLRVCIHIRAQSIECNVIAFKVHARQLSCRVPVLPSALLHRSVSWQQGEWGNQCEQTKTPPPAWRMLQSGEAGRQAGRQEMVSVQKYRGKKWVIRKSPYGWPPSPPPPNAWAMPALPAALQS